MTWILCYKQFIQTFSPCFSSSVVLLWTRRLCCCKLQDWLKLLLHSEHVYGFSPVWTLMWTCRLLDWVKVLSHMRHLNGFSPVWILIWTCRLTNWVKELSHMRHLYGFSPVWTRMWTFRFAARLNALSHIRHLYGLSPVWSVRFRTWLNSSPRALWMLLCITASYDVVNRSLQTVHWNGFSPEWRRMCSASSWLQRKHLLHSVHLCLPVWIFICFDRLLEDKKRLSHWVHGYTFSPVWQFMWSFKYRFNANRLSHTVHKYGHGLSSRECSVWSLLSASNFTSTELSPV